MNSKKQNTCSQDTFSLGITLVLLVAALSACQGEAGGEQAVLTSEGSEEVAASSSGQQLGLHELVSSLPLSTNWLSRNSFLNLDSEKETTVMALNYGSEPREILRIQAPEGVSLKLKRPIRVLLQIFTGDLSEDPCASLEVLCFDIRLEPTATLPLGLIGTAPIKIYTDIPGAEVQTIFVTGNPSMSPRAPVPPIPTVGQLIPASSDVLLSVPFVGRTNTLSTVFPDSDEGFSYFKSLSGFNRGTEIILYDNEAQGINKAASEVFYYLDGTWRKIGASGSFDDRVLSPNESFTLRNKSQQRLYFEASGALPKTRAQVLKVGAVARDIFTNSGMATSVSLRGLALGGTAAFATSSSAKALGDRLLVFDNAKAGYDKAPSQVYYYYRGAWRLLGAPSTLSQDREIIFPGTGFIIRKKAGTLKSPIWYQSF